MTTGPRALARPIPNNLPTRQTFGGCVRKIAYPRLTAGRTASILPGSRMTHMNRTRQIVAITLVATALCADRAVASVAPTAQRTEARVTSLAERFARKLSTNFRRVVPAMRLCERSRGEAVASNSNRPAPMLAFIAQQPISPFQFRLPPPSL